MIGSNMSTHQASDKLLRNPKTLATVGLSIQAKNMLHYNISSAGILI